MLINFSGLNRVSPNHKWSGVLVAQLKPFFRGEHKPVWTRSVLVDNSADSRKEGDRGWAKAGVYFFFLFLYTRTFPVFCHQHPACAVWPGSSSQLAGSGCAHLHSGHLLLPTNFKCRK